MVYIPFGYAQATLTFTGPTRTGQAATVLGMSTGSTTDLTALCEVIHNAFTASLRALVHQAFRLTEIRCIDIGAAGLYIVENGQGTRTGDLAPPNTSVLVSKGTALRGRSNRGRTYWPGMLNDQDVYDDGTLAPSRVSDIQTGMTDFWEDLLDPLGIEQYLLHSDEVAPTLVAFYGVQSKVATQRRRLR